MTEVAMPAPSVDPVIAKSAADEPKGTPFHIAVIGAGAVGSNTAFSIMTSDIGQSKVTLTDIAADMLRGQVMDLEDTAAAVKAATPQEAGQADIIILTAGRGLRDGETRLDCLKSNHGILKSVIGGMMPIKKSAVIIVVSNPCDILAYFVWKFSGLPSEQVIGSGTLLDTVRLRAALSSELGCHNDSINFNVLGEHGDSQFPATSLATIGGVPLAQYPGMEKVDMEAVAKGVREKGRLIREAKGATMFGVATSCKTIADCILKDQKKVLPVSVKVPGRECYLSLPCIVGASGCEQIIDVTSHLGPTEREQWEASLQKLEETMQDVQAPAVLVEKLTPGGNPGVVATTAVGA
jgi:L-lactate dehydrogenase